MVAGDPVDLVDQPAQRNAIRIGGRLVQPPAAKGGSTAAALGVLPECALAVVTGTPPLDHVAVQPIVCWGLTEVSRQGGQFGQTPGARSIAQLGCRQPCQNRVRCWWLGKASAPGSEAGTGSLLGADPPMPLDTPARPARPRTCFAPSPEAGGVVALGRVRQEQVKENLSVPAVTSPVRLFVVVWLRAWIMTWPMGVPSAEKIVLGSLMTVVLVETALELVITFCPCATPLRKEPSGKSVR